MTARSSPMVVSGLKPGPQSFEMWFPAPAVRPRAAPLRLKENVLGTLFDQFLSFSAILQVLTLEGTLDEPRAQAEQCKGILDKVTINCTRSAC